jgi:ATP-dependent helicase/nuclease subunit A
MPFEGSGAHWRGKGYFWRAASDTANAMSKAAALRARGLADDEYRRLLYVGMTRAEDRLIVCGYHGKRAQHVETWHARVSHALADAPESTERPHPASGEEPVVRFRATAWPPLAAQADEQAEAETFAPPPAALSKSLPPIEELPRPLSPSGAAALIDEADEPAIDGRSPVLDAEEEPGFAIRRGLVLHKLLQTLPGIPVEARRSAAERYLARAAADWPEAERAGALARVEAILANPRFAPIFAPGSRAEVAIMGEIELRGRRRSVSGKIDRLAVGDDMVWIVDYKTNRTAPASAAEAPPAYVLQLALYRALLRPLYPGRRIAAALLFTEAARLIELPEAALDQALARLTAA